MKPFNLRIALSLVIGNMIGAGIFTTLGIQLKAVPDARAILLLWLLAGLIAFCGAVGYARLATHFGI